MGDLVLLGASGYAGRLIAAALARRGTPFVAAGRDPERLREAVGPPSDLVTIRRIEALGRADVAALLDGGGGVVVSAVGPFAGRGEVVLEAALEHGYHYLDIAMEPGFVRWAMTTQDEAARALGLTAIPGCGYHGALGSLLAEVAARALARPRAAHVSHLTRGGGLGFGLSRGSRATLGTLLDQPVMAWDGGRLTSEGFAESRRLAWFPTPVGLHHAAGFPGLEPLAVPRHQPGLDTIRSYAALRAPLAEVAQLGASAARRWAPIRRLARRALAIGSEGLPPERREAVRWACVAEIEGASGEIVRAWANGRDVYGVTAAIAARAAQGLLQGRVRTAGVAAPAEAFDAAEWLDDLADETGLRWAVRRPSAPGPALGQATGPLPDGADPDS